MAGERRRVVREEPRRYIDCGEEEDKKRRFCILALEKQLHFTN